MTNTKWKNSDASIIITFDSATTATITTTTKYGTAAITDKLSCAVTITEGNVVFQDKDGNKYATMTYDLAKGVGTVKIGFTSFAVEKF